MSSNNLRFSKARKFQQNNENQALGYAKPENAIATHVDTEDKTTTLIQGTGSNYKSKVVIINESGLYALILSSKLPQAKAFKRWVTSEVLPQIRKTGGYIPTHAADGSDLSAEEILNRADAIVGRTLRLLNEPAEDTLTATQVAKTFNSLKKKIVEAKDRGAPVWITIK